MNQKSKIRLSPHRDPLVSWRLAALIALCAASALLAACGSSSTSSNGSAGASNQGTKQENTRLQFSKCMREHGVNIPETSAGSGPPAALVNTPQSTITAAATACRQYATGALGPAAAGNSTQITDTLVKFAACMRQNGVNIADPTESGVSALQAFAQQVERARQSPGFAAASKKCQNLLPNVPGGPSAETGAEG